MHQGKISTFHIWGKTVENRVAEQIRFETKRFITFLGGLLGVERDNNPNDLIVRENGTLRR